MQNIDVTLRALKGLEHLKDANLLAYVENALPQLPEDLRDFLVRLTVFRGSWSVDAAAAVLNTPIAAHQCADLHARNFILKEEAAGRYSMEPEIRDFLRTHLTEAARKILQSRHLQWFLALTRECGPRLERASDLDPLNQLEADKDNLFAAARFAQGADKVALALGLWRWALLRGHYSKGLQILGYAYALVRDAPQDAKITMLRGMGLLNRVTGKFPASRQHLTTSLRMAQKSQNDALRAQVLVDLAYVESLCGDHVAATKHYRQSIALWETQGDKWGLASALNGLGTHAWKQGSLEKACTYLYQSAMTFDELGDQAQTMKVYSNIGMLHAQCKDFAQAEKVHRMCLQHFRRYGNPDRIATSLLNLGDVLADQGSIPEAMEHLGESLLLMHQSGIFASLHMVLADMAFALSAPSRFQNLNQALMLFGAAEQLRERFQGSITPEFETAINQRLKEMQQKISPPVFGRLRKMGRNMSLEAIITKFGSSQALTAKGE